MISEKDVVALAEIIKEVDLPAGIIGHWRDAAGQHAKICREDAEALAREITIARRNENDILAMGRCNQGLADKLEAARAECDAAREALGKLVEAAEYATKPCSYNEMFSRLGKMLNVCNEARAAIKAAER